MVLIIKGKPLIPHGRKFTGTVVSSKAQQSATVEWYWRRLVPKYERFEQKRTRMQVHNPTEINATKGDKVIIQECRPISKTKNFVIIQILGKDVEYLEKEEAMEAGKKRVVQETQSVSERQNSEEILDEKEEVVEKEAEEAKLE